MRRPLFASGRFLEAVAKRVVETARGWEWGENDADAAVVEGAQAGEEVVGELFGVLPIAPGVGVALRQDGPVVREKEAHAASLLPMGLGGFEKGVFQVEGGVDEDELCAGGVVTDAYAGRWECGGVGGGGWWREDFHGDAGGRGELGGGYGSGTVEDHGCLGGVEDGGFEADGGGASVEDGVDAGVEVGEDVGGGGGAGVAEAVGAWGGDGNGRGFEQGSCGGVRGDADADERAAGGDGVRDGFCAGEQESERAGPEARYEMRDTRYEMGWDFGDGAELGCGGYVDDEGGPRRGAAWRRRCWRRLRARARWLRGRRRFRWRRRRGGWSGGARRRGRGRRGWRRGDGAWMA